VAEALALIELLDERIAPLEREPGPLAGADGRGCSARSPASVPGSG
jgi:hypothetical protein